MSKPFIIWTMQRTGGTALTELLMDMSEHRSAEHEPFNWARKNPRQFWPVADAWNKTRDPEALAGSLDAIFADRTLIKHCYELLNMEFNEHLVRAAARAGYRHLHLLRRDEPARLISKFIAEAQGTWFRDYSRKVFAEVAEGQRALGPLPVEDMVAHFRHCRRVTGIVAGWLAELGPDCRRVYYEDLYSGDRQTRLANLAGLFEFLGFTGEDIARHRAAIDGKIFHGGQDTRSVAPFVPNLDAVHEALAAAGASGEGIAEIPRKPQGGGPKPAARMAAEFRRLVEQQAFHGPVLELGVAAAGESVLSGERFEGMARHALGPALETGRTEDGLALHRGEPGDMRALFPGGMFGAVVWNDALVHERHFWRALDELRRVLAPGGTLILAVPGFSRAANQAGVTVSRANGNAIPDTTPTYRIHASPDYWRISPQAMRQVILDGYEVREVRVSSMPPRIFGVGVKPAADAPAGRAAAD